MAGMTDTVRQGIFLLWSFFLFLWLIMLPGIGMAFDAGDTFQARMFVASYLSYPLSFGIAFLLRKKAPVFVLFPLLSIIWHEIANNATGAR
jgi:hypothetical protein